MARKDHLITIQEDSKLSKKFASRNDVIAFQAQQPTIAQQINGIGATSKTPDEVKDTKFPVLNPIDPIGKNLTDALDIDLALENSPFHCLELSDVGATVATLTVNLINLVKNKAEKFILDITKDPANTIDPTIAFSPTVENLPAGFPTTDPRYLLEIVARATPTETRFEVVNRIGTTGVSFPLTPDVKVHGNVTGAVTIDLSLITAHYHTMILIGNITFTFSNPPATNKELSFILDITQDATGGRTVGWPPEVRVDPTVGSGANDRTVIIVTTVDNGVNYDALIVTGGEVDAANKTLSNLTSPTAINQDLILTGNDLIDVGTVNSINSPLPVTLGFVNMANIDILSWRNFDNTADLSIRASPSVTGLELLGGSTSLADNDLINVKHIIGRDETAPTATFRIIFNGAAASDTFIADNSTDEDRIDHYANNINIFTTTYDTANARGVVAVTSGTKNLLDVGTNPILFADATPVIDADIANEQGFVYFDTATDPPILFIKKKDSLGVVSSVSLEGAGSAGNSISQLDSSATITDTGTDGAFKVVLDGTEHIVADNTNLFQLTDMGLVVRESVGGDQLSIDQNPTNVTFTETTGNSMIWVINGTQMTLTDTLLTINNNITLNGSLDMTNGNVTAINSLDFDDGHEINGLLTSLVIKLGAANDTFKIQTSALSNRFQILNNDDIEIGAGLGSLKFTTGNGILDNIILRDAGNFDFRVATSQDMIFFEGATEVMRYDGGLNEWQFRQNIIINETNTATKIAEIQGFASSPNALVFELVSTADLFITDAGTTMLHFDNSARLWNFAGANVLRTPVELQINDTLFTPGTPPAGNAVLYIFDAGAGDQSLRIKFDNGQIREIAID